MIKIELPFIQPFRAPQRKGRVYFDPLHDKKVQAKWMVKEQYSGMPLNGPICSVVEFEVPMAVSTSKKKKSELEGFPCLKKIDVDNLQKFCFDVIKGLVIEDDSQIWNLSVKKIWAQKPLTKIYIWQEKKE